MLLIRKHGYCKRYAYGGSGLFDTVGQLITKLVTSDAGRKIGTAALDAGKNIAIDTGKKF